MNTHMRSDSRACQSRILTSNPSGERSCLVRSLATADPVRGEATGAALQKLADGIHCDNWPRIKALCEDVFVASGHPVPIIMREPVPVLLMLHGFAEGYLERKGAKVRKKGRKVSASHLSLCKRVLMGFARQHKGLELGQVIGAHVQAWVDVQVKEKASGGTIKNMLAIVNGMFRHAVAMGHIRGNPCADVEVPDASDGAVMREPMADADFAKLLAHLETLQLPDWVTVCMLSRYAGLRLRDAALVVGSGVRFIEDACLVEAAVGKTARGEVIPVYEPLSGHLRRFVGHLGELSPSLSPLSASRLSKCFSNLCDEAGLDAREVALPNGRKHRRISFHSLRHAMISDLARRGIPIALRMRMSAHVTESAHNRYDHSGAMDLHAQVRSYFQ